MDMTIDRRSSASAQPATATPLVSVIVPTHRRPELLRRALRSVLAQTYPAIEIHVVENGARAGAEQIVNELGGVARGLSYHFVPRGNVCVARNAGIERSRGAYCALLDDDDEWAPDKLALQVARLEADRELGWIACRVWWQTESPGPVRSFEQPAYQGPSSYADLVREGNLIWSTSCTVVRQECFARVGMFDPRYRYANDYELYLRLARQFPFAILEEPLVRYYQHEGNMSRRRARQWRYVLKIYAALKPCPSLGLTASDIRKAMDRYCEWSLERALEAHERGDDARASRYFFTALRYDPAIGLKIPWSRINHPAYRVIRPYVHCALCGVRGWIKSRRHPGMPGSDDDRHER